MFSRLPPAGDPIVLGPSLSSQEDVEQLFAPMYLRCYRSGAMSLAAAILAINQVSSVDQPEVILPAYSCPELVSAVLYAKANPVLVDLESERPWMSIDAIESKLNKNTIAIIAVNLFGIPERIEKIRSIIKSNKIFVIEDSAQSFPQQLSKDSWKGDIVVLSFGRGKPVSLLGGGMVLSCHREFYDSLPTVGCKNEPASQLSLFKYALKVYLYNFLISPTVYWIPHNLPFLKLGEVKFHPLDRIDAFPEVNINYLIENCKYYFTKGIANQESISRIVDGLKEQGYINLPAECGVSSQKLIRFPLLAPNKGEREKVYICLDSKGLGVSKMYQQALNKIEGLGELLSDQGPFPNAENFADRLITLPIHSNVLNTHIHQIQQLLASAV